MKFTCNKDNLIECINIVQKAIPSKSSINILECMLIEVGEELRFTGSDGDFGIVYEIPGIIEEIGSIIVNSKTFGDIIRKLPDIYVTIESIDDNTISITSRNANYKINVFNNEGYPPVEFIDNTNEFKMNESSLCKLIKQTSFAACLEDKRVILKGVFMEQKDKKLNFVAIDGYRLALRFTEVDDSREFGVIVPTKILNELAKSIKGEEEIIKFCCNDNQIMFYNDKFRMISKLYKGDYVDYKKMFPKEYKTTCKIKTKELLDSFERAQLVMKDERKYPLSVKFTKNDEVIVYINAENGVLREVINAEVSGEEIELGLSIKNVIECLRVINDEEIVISLTSAVGPCVITGVSDKEFIFLTMPVKLNKAR